MRTERKNALLSMFPLFPIPQSCLYEMEGKGAANFLICLTAGNELFIRGYHRYSTGNIVERQRYVFAKDGYVRYGTNFKGEWSIRTEFREPVFCSTAFGYSFDNSYTVLNIKAISKSCMKYSLAEDSKKRLFIEYLRLYCKHPNIEYLLKSGYYPIEETVSGYWGGRISLSVWSGIDWKSNNLLKMLHLNRTEFSALKGNESYYRSYIRWREIFPKLKPQDLLLIAKTFKDEHGTLNTFCTATGLKPQRIARYLNENNIRTYDYYDYIGQCEQLGYDMHDTAISMPHKFFAMHERLSAIITFKETEKLRTEFAKNYDSRKVLEYHFENLFIRQPESYDEIITEGKALSHCVGGYADRHSKGALHILFIRARDKPNVPFYTVEVNTLGYIVQVRGFKNADMTEEVERFMSQYKLYLSEIFRRKRAKSA